MQDSQHITYIEEKEYPLWDEFVRSSPQGSFFYTTVWAEILRNTFKREYKIAVFRRQENWLAGTILFMNRRMGLSLITPIPLYFFNAPIYYNPIDEKYQRTVANQLEISEAYIRFFSANFRLWMLTTPHHITDVRAYQWSGCRVEPTYSYVFELNMEGDPAEYYSQSVRRKIRQAEENGAKVVQNQTPDEFIQLYQKSYERHDLRPYVDADTLRFFFDNISALPQLKLYYVQIDGKKVAGRLVCCDNRSVFDLLAGSSDPSGSASVYLMDQIIREHLQDYSSFDFMGADHKQIEQFKRGFGAKLVHGFKITGRLSFPISILYSFQEHYLQRSRIL